MTSYEERVERGAALLDARYGPDWRERINLDRLNVSCASNCILGQLYGDFHQAFSYLGREVLGEAASYGFYEDAHDRDYYRLNATWAAYITKDSDLALAGD